MSVESLSEVMGEEYAQSYPGQLYSAYERVMQETSTNKFKGLGKKVLALTPPELRDRIGYEPTFVNGQVVARWGKDQAWFDMPPVNGATLADLSATIMWIAPRNGKSLIQLLHQDPRQFLWQSLDVFKLLASIHGIGGGWH